jgi:hypothetical protein
MQGSTVTSVADFENEPEGLNLNEGTNRTEDENGGVAANIQDARNRSVWINSSEALKITVAATDGDGRKISLT